MGPEARVSGFRCHVGGLEDSRLRGSGEGWGVLRRTPNPRPQEVQEPRRFAGGLEVQIDDDVVGVIDRAQDTVAADTGFLARLREAVECGFPLPKSVIGCSMWSVAIPWSPSGRGPEPAAALFCSFSALLSCQARVQAGCTGYGESCRTRRQWTERRTRRNQRLARNLL